eukprot:scaffold413_cov168-Amphora_coffeaeformis.AAC.1
MHVPELPIQLRRPLGCNSYNHFFFDDQLPALATDMALKWPRKGEPASGATRRQKPTRRRTCFMNAAASVAESRAMTS